MSPNPPLLHLHCLSYSVLAFKLDLAKLCIAHVSIKDTAIQESQAVFWRIERTRGDPRMMGSWKSGLTRKIINSRYSQAKMQDVQIGQVAEMSVDVEKLGIEEVWLWMVGEGGTPVAVAGE